MIALLTALVLAQPAARVPPGVGELYAATETGTLLLSALDPTYYIWNPGATGATGVCSADVTCSTNGTIRVKWGGIYQVSASAGLQCNADSQRIEIRVFKNSTALGNCQNSGVVGTSEKEAALATVCFVKLESDDYVTLRFSNSSATGKTITIKHANLNIHRIF